MLFLKTKCLHMFLYISVRLDTSLFEEGLDSVMTVTMATQSLGLVVLPAERTNWHVQLLLRGFVPGAKATPMPSLDSLACRRKPPTEITAYGTRPAFSRIILLPLEIEPTSCTRSSRVFSIQAADVV
jgi:hypothetical protein